MLEENNVPLKLTSNDFVFWMSQGCMFCFFKLDEGENPPVHFYSESKKKDGFYKITDTFTEFLQRRYIKDRYIFQKKNGLLNNSLMDAIANKVGGKYSVFK